MNGFKPFDPNSNAVTGPEGSSNNAIALWDGIVGSALKDSTVIVDSSGRMTFTALNNNTNSMESTSVVEVFDSSDLDDLAVNNVITINSPTVFVIKNPELETTSRFFLEAVTERPRLQIIGESALFSLEYTGPSGVTFISGSRCDVFIDVALVDRVGVTLMDLDNGVTRFGNNIVRLWDDLGTQDSGDFEVMNTRFEGWGSGFKINNTRQVTIDSPKSINDPVGGIFFDIVNNLTDDRVIEIVGVSGTLDPTTSLIKIDPSLRDSDRVSISNCVLSSGLLFEESGTDGTFTAVVDASITTPVSVDSITGSFGTLATFNFTAGPTLHVGQQVILTGFSVGNYNRTIQISDTGAGFFRSNSIFFSSEGTLGTFTSDSITITDTATTLIDGDSVNISTDEATDYDGGSSVYDQQTNSVRINRAYNPSGDNPQTGTWSTKGLNQKDVKVLTNNNSNFIDSKYIACAYVNNNSTAVGTIVNNTFTDMVFGTAGSALIECTNTERFKLIDELNGTFVYLGEEPFDGELIYSLTADSSGGAQEFRVKFLKDVGAGFVDLANPTEMASEIGNASANISSIAPTELSKGDKIKPAITRSSGTSGVTIRYFSLTTSN